MQSTSWETLGWRKHNLESRLPGEISITSEREREKRMWELDHKESWEPKNWCFWAMVLAKTLKSPLDCKEIQLVHPKGNQPWIFIGRTDAEAPILWPPDAKNWLIRKDPEAGKDWRQEEKGMTEDEVFWCHHQLDGHEIEQALGVSDRQGSLVCCSPQSLPWLTELRCKQIHWQWNILNFCRMFLKFLFCLYALALTFPALVFASVLILPW